MENEIVSQFNVINAYIHIFVIFGNIGALVVSNKTGRGRVMHYVKFELKLQFSYKKMKLKMSFVKWRPFCLGLNIKLP